MVARPHDNHGMQSIIAALLTHAEHQPNKRCVVWQDRTYSYAEMCDGALTFAHDLQQLDLQPGEHVALFLENSIEFLFAYFGIGLVGGVVVLVNNTYKQTELRHILNDSAARIVITAGAQRTELNRIQADLPHLQHILDIGIPPTLSSFSLITPSPHHPITNLHAPDASHPAIIGYTSGTTGRSKGAVLLHRNLAANIGAVCAAWRWSPASPAPR